MKKLAAFFLTVAALAGCSNPYAIPAGDENKFRVGVILPLSGEVAAIGESSRRAAEMSFDELPEELREKFTLVFEDDGFAPMKTVTALQKLRSIDKIDALVTFTSTTSNAVAPIAERAKIPMIAGTSGSPSIVEGRDWVVKHWVTPDSLAKKLVPEALRRYKKIAAIWAIEEGVLALKKAFYDELGDRAEGFVVIDEEWQPTGVWDFKIFALKAREAGVDAINVRLIPGQTGLFVRQAREMGFEGDFFGWETFEDANDVKLSNEKMVGGWYVNSSPASSDFVQKFTEKFGESPLIGADSTYDIIKILARAVEEFTPEMTAEEKRAAVNREFHELRDFCGAMGCYSADGKNSFTLPATLKVVTGSGFEAMEVGDKN